MFPAGDLNQAEEGDVLQASSSAACVPTPRSGHGVGWAAALAGII